jgi:hypothetical protein
MWNDLLPDYDSDENFFLEIKDDKLMILLKAMFIYNPDDRITALDAISGSYFDLVRKDEYEEGLDIDCLESLEERMRYPAASHINLDLRYEVLQQILQISREKNLITKTFLLSVQYFDEFLCRESDNSPILANRQILEDIALACLDIAANLVEPNPPVSSYGTIDWFNDIGRKLRYEITRKLGGDLIIATSYDFHILLDRSKISEEQIRHINLLLTESAIREMPFTHLAIDIFEATKDLVIESNREKDEITDSI